MPAVSAANYSTFNRAAGFLPAVPWAAWACGTRITSEVPAPNANLGAESRPK